MKSSIHRISKILLFGLIVLSMLFIGGCSDSGDDSNPFANTGYTRDTKPTTPHNLTAIPVSATQIDLSWDASSSIDVTGYNIYRDKKFIQSVTGTTASDTGLSSSTTYCYRISAVNKDNKESGKCKEACATTFFTKRLGTNMDDYGQEVAVDSSGNVYIAGYTYGSMDGFNTGGFDMFLVKYDAAGTKQWTRQLSTKSGVDIWQVRIGVAVDSSGNIYVTGITTVALDGNTYAGSYDMFLVKYDSDGNKQWTRQLGTGTYDYGNDVAVDASGNVYVSGSTYGSLDGNTSAGDWDMFLVKYDSEGQKQWTKQLGTGTTDYGFGVAVDNSGNIYVSGSTYGNLGGVQYGGYDMFLVKYNSAGDVQWTKQMGSTDSDSALSGCRVAVDSTNGYVYITGDTLGSIDGQPFSGNYDVYLMKYDVDGNYQWTRMLGGTSTDAGLNVAVDADGYVYVTGTAYSTPFGGIDKSWDYDMFLVKYDSVGNRQWTRIQEGANSTDFGQGVAVGANGYIYVTGTTYSDVFDGNYRLGLWNYDVFLVKYDENGVRQ
jgi:uncharacterized protein (UPF0548 family)